MTGPERDYILELINRDLEHARDAIARAEMQQKRMPFDHDNNNALSRYQMWEVRATRALLNFAGIQ